jgi:hypothetical protein
MSYKATFSLSQRLPLNTGLTELAIRLQVLDSSLVFGTHNFLQTLKSVLVGHLTPDFFTGSHTNFILQGSLDLNCADNHLL